MKYKYSRYNWIFDYDDTTFAANGFTGAMAVVDADKRELFKQHLGSSANISAFLNAIGEETVKNLLHGGFIIDDFYDERRVLEFKFRCKSYAELSSITVVPTMACNFNCTYCYQEGGDTASDVIDDSVMKKIVEIARQCRQRIFRISFTGGEPLLYPERVIELCNRVKEAREEIGLEFRANIITNGYSITEETAKALKNGGVTKMQITLDGDERTHNARRPLKNGNGTFSQIVSNIRLAANYFQMNIRVNCESVLDRQHKSVMDLFKDIDSIRITPAATRYDHRGKQDLTATNAKSLHRQLEAMPTEKCIQSFKPTIAGCSATNAYGIVILPDGSVCKCWHEITGVLRNRYGTLLNQSSFPIQRTEKLWGWLDFNPYQPHSPCFDCKILPNCGGGCPANWVLDDETECSQPEFRAEFPNFLNEAANRLVSSRQE